MAQFPKGCLVCLKKSGTSVETCPHCHVNKTKTKRELATDEKKLRTGFANLRQVGLLFLFWGILGIAIPILLSSYELFEISAFHKAFLFSCSIFYILVGVALRAYFSWAFWLSVFLLLLNAVGWIALFVTGGVPGLSIAPVVVTLVILLCLLSPSSTNALYLNKNVY